MSRSKFSVGVLLGAVAGIISGSAAAVPEQNEPASPVSGPASGKRFRGGVGPGRNWYRHNGKFAGAQATASDSNLPHVNDVILAAIDKRERKGRKARADLAASKRQ